MERFLEKIETSLQAVKRRPVTSYYPSSASRWLPDGELIGPCLREQYWKIKAVEPSNLTNLSGQFKMSAGYKLEDIMAEWLGKVVPLARQVEITLDSPLLSMPVHGYIDGMYVDPDTGKHIILEIKSTYGRGVTDIRKNGIKPEWWLQVALYAMGIKRNYPWLELGGWKFLVLGRDNGYLCEVDKPIDWDAVNETVVAIVYRWRWLELYLKHNRLPPAEYRHKGNKGDWSHWKCRYSATNKSKDGYCPYRQMCQEIEANKGGTE